MKIEIDWRQKSSIRGAVWIFGGLVSLLFIWFGKDPTAVMATTASVAGGIGVAVKD